MDLLMQQMKQQWPEQLRGYGVRLVSLHESIVGEVRDRVLLFFGAAGIVLLVACVNVANLGMARAVTRFRELAVRAAMGAGRWRLVRQLGLEGITMALAAGGVGILIAAVALSAVVSVAPPGIPRLDTVRLDPVALAFAVGLSLLIGLLVGIVPALRAARRNLFGALRAGGRSAVADSGTMRLRSGFVVAQVTLAIVLTIGAGLLVKSFSRLSRVDAGIRTDGVLAATVGVPSSRYSDAAGGRFLLDYVDRLRRVPGVEAAAVSTQLPLEGFSIGFTFWREGQNLPLNERQVGDFRVVSPGYFETAGIRLLRGRTFDERDRLESASVVVIDEALARQEFGNGDPIGRRIHISYGKDAVAREIVGLVSNVRQRALDVPVAPGYYLPLTQVTWSTMRVIVRSPLEPMALAEAMRRELAAMDPLIPLRNVSTLDDLLAGSVRVPRFSMLLFGAFAAMTLLLAATGIYSVMSYSVAQRTSEIGLRMALGAPRTAVVGEVVRKGLLLVALGLILGLAGALGLTRTLTSFLFGVQPTDPATFAAVSALLLLVATVASYIPARRAASVDPVTALRAE
jgi:predicted permease